MLFVEVATASQSLANTASRTAKAEILAKLLLDAVHPQPNGDEITSQPNGDEVRAIVGFLTGDLRQGRVGIGTRSLQSSLTSASNTNPTVVTPTVTVAELDDLVTTFANLAGPGSTTTRTDLLTDLLARATPVEVRLLLGIFGGDLRQGALHGVMLDAVARASGVPIKIVRRAVMLGGRLGDVAAIALTQGSDAVAAVGLEVGRAVGPMLASTAPSASEAVTDLGRAAVEWKLDGIRIQVHRQGSDVRVFTRSLHDITERMSPIVEVALSLEAESFVLDGEALMLDTSGRPAMFQDTASAVSTDGGPGLATEGFQTRPFFFDILHLNGVDLIDRSFEERRSMLFDLAGAWQVPGEITTEADEGERVFSAAIQAGHEGVVAKGATSRYEAGRRGKAWRKVKPVHTLDLVVIGVEWGYGRRTGWLSNLHLAARDTSGSAPEVPPTGGQVNWVMVGKTFKGLTDQLLTWQTQRFLELAVSFEHGPDARHGVVTVRPEQVVEIAVDGVQRSSRYPGGVALRFARVLRYRSDKALSDADSIEEVRALLPTDPPAVHTVVAPWWLRLQHRFVMAP